MTHVQHVNDQQAREAIASGQTVLVDFWAPWCGPCRQMKPVVESAAEQRPAVSVMAIDIDQDPGLAGEHRVMSIPTLLLFKDGHLVAEHRGGATGVADVLRLLDS